MMSNLLTTHKFVLNLNSLREPSVLSIFIAVLLIKKKVVTIRKWIQWFLLTTGGKDLRWRLTMFVLCLPELKTSLIDTLIDRREYTMKIEIKTAFFLFLTFSCYLCVSFLQWVVLTRKHARIVVEDETVFPMFQLHCKVIILIIPFRITFWSGVDCICNAIRLFYIP